MQISTGKVVLIDYTLTDNQNQTIDSSEGREPLAYIHGIGQIIPGLEKALAGKTIGETLKVAIAAAEGYGARDEAKVATIPRSQVQGAGELEPGMQLHAQNAQGEQVVTITKIEADTITIDGNHPLAGVDLNFDVTIREVRDATPEETAHGHAHGPGGHHH